MKIKATQVAEASEYRVILFSKISELPPLSLSKNEQEYLEVFAKNKSTKIGVINQFPNFIYFVKVDEEIKNKPQFQEQLRIRGTEVAKRLNTEHCKSVSIESASNVNWAYYVAEGAALANYQFLRYFSKRDELKNSLEEIQIVKGSTDEVNALNCLIGGVYTARDLVNEPLSYLTAPQLAQQIEAIGAQSGFRVETLNKKKIESLKMGGLLAVNKGSIDPPTFSIMEYKPENAQNSKPIVLVGKGVVYDTGGLSLKPTANSMDSMKSDMAGAAAVVGALQAVSEAKLPLHIVGLVPATDNRPSGNAYAPGDVVTMFDGSTVEVLNTDAEGRMLLADALSYAKKFDPQVVFDLATLTGAAAVAVGKHGIVSMGTAGKDWMDKLETAGQEVYERIAPFPFWDEYNDLLKSSIADVKNIGGREGGAITAGKFLERFTDYPWIHLDIAGVAFLDAPHNYRPKGGTGSGVRLLFEMLKNEVK